MTSVMFDLCSTFELGVEAFREVVVEILHALR